MKMKKLGRTGLDVSALCLGCMTYGVPDRGPPPWTLPEDESRPLIHQALDLGIDVFDTADSHADRTIVSKVAEVAESRGVPRAQLTLAWVAAKPEVAAPIVGASKPGHLADAVAALDLVLTADEIAALEAPYTPHPIVGFS